MVGRKTARQQAGCISCAPNRIKQGVFVFVPVIVFVFVPVIVSIFVFV